MSNRSTTVAIVVLLLGILATAAYFFSNPIVPSSSTTYLYPEIDHKQPVCPGDTIKFFQSARINNAPITVQFVETVVNFDTGATILPDATPLYYNYLHGGVRSGDVTWTVPDISPGHYELRRATNPWGRTTAMYVVYFTVKEGC